jgi:O-antigen/teichoic acid export membrane protein
LRTFSSLASIVEKTTVKIFGTGSFQKYVKGYVAKNSIILFCIHCLSILLVFFSNYVIIKAAGADSYGAYVYLFNLVYLLVSFCILGVDTLLLKNMPVLFHAGKYSQLKGLLVYAFIIIIITSMIFGGLFNTIVELAGSRNSLATVNGFTFAFLSLFMLSVMGILQVILQGMRKPVWSQAGEKIIRPFLLILLVVILYYFNSGVSLDKLIWINVVSIGITMMVALGMCRKVITAKLDNIPAAYDLKKWMTASFAFFLAALLYNCNSRVSIFLLGIYQSKHDVGIFNIALRISEVISFALVIVNFVLSPVITRLYANGKREQLQNLVTRSARITALIGLLLVLGVFLFSEQILLLFGMDFLAGRQALIILCLGQLVNIFCGSVGLLLLMTGNQRFSIYSLGGGTIINILLNIILIPRFGMNGAAIASSAGLITWNIMMYFFVRKRLDIRTTPFKFM